MKRLIVCLSMALLLAGCAAQFSADVTRFNALGGSPTGRSFSVVTEANQTGALDFHYYAAQVGDALQSHGLIAAAPTVAPDLVVLVHYGTAGAHTETVYAPYEYPHGWGGFRHGRWGYDPIYPYPPDWWEITRYSHVLEVELLDGPAWRAGHRTMLFQGRAVTDSQYNDPNVAMPRLVKALFNTFPGISGQTERVTLPVDGGTPITVTPLAPVPPAPTVKEKAPA